MDVWSAQQDLAEKPQTTFTNDFNLSSPMGTRLATVPTEAARLAVISQPCSAAKGSLRRMNAPLPLPRGSYLHISRRAAPVGTVATLFLSETMENSVSLDLDLSWMSAITQPTSVALVERCRTANKLVSSSCPVQLALPIAIAS